MLKIVSNSRFFILCWFDDFFNGFLLKFTKFWRKISNHDPAVVHSALSRGGWRNFPQGIYTRLQIWLPNLFISAESCFKFTISYLLLIWRLFYWFPIKIHEILLWNASTSKLFSLLLKTIHSSANIIPVNPVLLLKGRRVGQLLEFWSYLHED